MITKPLVLLDVDGVINDLDFAGAHSGEWKATVFQSNGFILAIPDFMAGLIQEISNVCEVHWCTTWRDKANGDIADFLGVGPFPVVDDGTDDRYVGWKSAAAYAVAEDALRDGRRVLWIEDFYGELPVDDMPFGTEFLDTADNPLGPVLLKECIPSWLTKLMAQHDIEVTD